jgi:nitrate/TMAO reductase-like tetraheme cytochrome c subunit
MKRARFAFVALAAIAAAACGDGPVRSIAELQDPQTCKECHPKHFDQWSGSMHAYASDDPVFVAMNQRGQRETNGSLGTFCVQCHAPMAVQLGLTTGANFDPAQLPPIARGITCYFCHNAKAVTADHNNGVVLANDQTMRGGVTDPVSSPAHHSSYDTLMDSDKNQSEICGSCHDVVTPRGVELERTFAEWKTTIFASTIARQHLSCGDCHMRSSTGVIADAPGLDVKSRAAGFHEHLWPGIDQALTAFPQLEEQAAAIKRDLDPAVVIVGPAPFASNVQPGGICLDPPGTLTVRVDSIGTGHKWPTGAAQDRRAWLEMIATDADGKVVTSSGVVADGEDPPERTRIDEADDMHLTHMWDSAFKDDGSPAHFFWDIAQVRSELLRAPITLDKNSPDFDHSSKARFDVGPAFTSIETITARIRIRPLSYALLDDLVGSGDLAPAVAGQLRTLEIFGAQSTWNRATKGTGAAMNTNCNPR